VRREKPFPTSEEEEPEEDIPEEKIVRSNGGSARTDRKTKDKKG
jgi:hypothetical protein